MPKLLLLLLAVRAGAVEPVVPACPAGARPRFTANPFTVWACPSKDAGAPNPAPADAVIGKKERLAVDFGELAGNWRGVTGYGPSRYEMRLTLDKKGRGQWWLMDYHTHLLRHMRGSLSPVFFDKGHLRGKLEAEHLDAVIVDAYSGKPSSTTAAGYDRRLIWTVEGLADRHELVYGVSGKELRFQYRYLPERGPALGSTAVLYKED